MLKKLIINTLFIIYLEFLYGILIYSEYLKNSILNQRIHEISETLLTHSNKSALEILGRPDDLKVCSSMTLFNIISPNDIFAKVLEVFYQGKGCEKTISEICSKK